MNEIERNRYCVCIKQLTDEKTILKDARAFCDAKRLEELFPKECSEIREALKIKYVGI